MLHMHPMLLAWILVAGFAPTAAETTGYRRLTTGELQALLSGSRINQPDIQQSYARTPEDFLPDGTHIRHADNYEGRGRYDIRDDSVCVTDERKREFCRRVMIDRDGQYWITKRNKTPGLIRISVS